MKYFIGTCFILFIAFQGLSQHEEDIVDSTSHNAEHAKNIVSFSVGYAYVQDGAANGTASSEGVFVPSIGFNYFRTIKHKWKVGLMSELELANYVIVKSELNRERAFILAGCGVYEPLPFISIIFGSGIELEKHKNFAIFRAGFQLPFHFHNGWVLEPELMFDFKQGYNTATIALGIGYNF